MTPTIFSDVVDIFINLIYLAVPVLGGVAVLVFFWGLVKFILAIGGDEKAVSQGRTLMVWGTIALFIMISLWGIIRFLHSEFGFTGFGLPLLPQ